LYCELYSFEIMVDRLTTTGRIGASHSRCHYLRREIAGIPARKEN
jgi:hypothetical protein